MTARLNSIASSLLWLWGALVLLGGFAIGYPALVTQGTPLLLIIFGLWGAASCIAAFALRNRRWGVRWWGSALCLLSIPVMLVVQVKLSLLGLFVNLAGLILIIASWRVEPQQGVPADRSRPAGEPGG